MSPTFKDGDWIFWSKNIYNDTKLQRGDIIILSYPGDPTNKTYIRRIVGLPGEKVEIKDEYVFVNDAKKDEDYIRYSVGTDPGGVWTLTSDQYFVMGDNRGASSDSRAFGPIKKGSIRGKTWLVYWPIVKSNKYAGARTISGIKYTIPDSFKD